MDRTAFSDIAPYYGEDVESAVERLKARREYLGAMAFMLSGNDIEMIEPVVKSLDSLLSNVHSYNDFQRQLTAGFMIPAIVNKTMTAFTVSGVEKLDPNKGYLFISNHRDIILDCMLLDYALLLAGKPCCEMAVGDNLMVNQFVEDLFRINGGIIVKRTLPMREKYLESIRLSKYFVETVSEENINIWVAQMSGRSKDGLDKTQPAIIKMLYLSKRNSGISFQDLIKNCNIVPVSISYQYDPNDINKGREEHMKTMNEGKYEKKKYEDLISMVKGLRCQKGRCHISIGEPLTGDYDSPEAVADEIDRQIHLNYMLFDTNYIAYDFLEKTDRFASEYTPEAKAEFLKKFEHLAEDVRDFVLNSYANAVRSQLKEKELEA